MKKMLCLAISLVIGLLMFLSSTAAFAEAQIVETIEETVEEKTDIERPSYNGKPLEIEWLPDDVIVSIVDTLTVLVPPMKDLFVNPYSVEIKEAKYLWSGNYWFKFLCTNKFGGTVVEELLLSEVDSSWRVDRRQYMIDFELNTMSWCNREFSENDIAWLNSLLQ